ncbi:MAG: 4-hydroxythreonine-4-phosphate dehydrogenase PdxA [Gammaproteobacteria bacterium]|nr:4-hydroxythreonine-4-phosphate dehydrogenase PdxA [Gammaproteobacteria bacterium]
MSIPRLLISAGEPAGIGPDILILASHHQFDADIITIGDPVLFQQRANMLGVDIHIEEVSLSDARQVTPSGTLKVLPVKLKRPVIPGQLDKENARYVLNVLDEGIRACLCGDGDAIVTGPIQKSILNYINPNFSGHTEYLAEKTASELPVMMLATEGLRVALVTTHVPLAQIPSLITKKRLSQIIKILAHDLKSQFNINDPKILVTGLNPHAGENGHLGTEEQEIIEPVIKQFQSMGLDISGPYPADTLFTPKYLEDADAVLAMYHDQGLPVLKYKGFGNAINVTLGLPITRTSVDHGTALDLAGTGNVNPQSMLLAIQTALAVVNSKSRKQETNINETQTA